MDYINFIKSLDFQPSHKRQAIIIEWLNDNSIDYRTHVYATGKNLIVDIGGGPWIGVSSHFDRVDTTAGANDNSSAIAVCIGLISRLSKTNSQLGVGVRLFFFDEEENGLRGSSAYVNDYGTNDLIGLINMEMVGKGEMIAIWPVDHASQTPILDAFESMASLQNVISLRFDRIVTNSADHVPFIKDGLNDTFTVTCLSKEDLLVSEKYFHALKHGTNPNDLFEILSSAPLFNHYHQPTDTFEKIEERSLQMVVDVIQKTIEAISRKYQA